MGLVKLRSFLLLPALAVLAVAPSGGWSAAEDDAPVTRKEVADAIAKVEGALSRSLKLSFKKTTMPADGQAATRGEIIGELERMVASTRSEYRWTPRAYRTNQTAVFAVNEPFDGERIMRLARLGFVAPVGPLAIGPGKGLTPEQFGDALGLCASQIASLTHKSSAKFTPWLMP